MDNWKYNRLTEESCWYYMEIRDVELKDTEVSKEPGGVRAALQIFHKSDFLKSLVFQKLALSQIRVTYLLYFSIFQKLALLQIRVTYPCYLLAARSNPEMTEKNTSPKLRATL